MLRPHGSPSSARVLCQPILFLVALAPLLHAGAAEACTTFCLRDGDRVIFGKNYDWNVPDGHLIVNPRGIARISFDGEDRATHWTSRFGSVTFNQYGRDFPSGGINEAGLVVELMWLSEGEYPRPDERTEIGNLQWIQYQLDTASTIDEVMRSHEAIRIAARSPLHYLVADASGSLATIEFLDGDLVVHTGESLPYPALTNSTYTSSREFVAQRIDGPAAEGNGSLARFERATRSALAFPRRGGEDAVSYAFEILADVAQVRRGPDGQPFSSRTQWSIVYEMDAITERKRVHFRTRDNASVRWLDLADIDFECRSGARTVDLLADLEGDLASHLRPAERATNHQLIRSSYRQTRFLAGIPASVLEQIADYPDSATCVRAEAGSSGD